MDKLVCNVEYENIGSHGQIATNFTYEDFLSIGVDYGDTVELSFLGKKIIVPFVPSYRCTRPGGTVIFVGGEFKHANIMDFHSNFVRNHRIAAFLENEDRQIDIMVCKGIKFPIEMIFKLDKKNGYKEEFEVFNLIRTNERLDYRDLTDEEYCNFRNVCVGNIKEGLLYRSSSPINNYMCRAKYADMACKKYGIKSIINLCDSEESAKEFPGYKDTYYSKQNILFLNSSADVVSYNFGKSVLKAIRFINENEGPYLIHCMEGQDRTGTVCALFESLLNATKNQITNDFMKTYENFYRVKKDSHQYNRILSAQNQQNIVSIRGFTFDVLDVLKSPKGYFNFLDLTDEDIDKFIKKLSK